MTTFVIVHGGWSGGWYFQDTARLMRGAGHEVYPPTLTGIGERVHLGRPDTDLDTHIQDIVNVLEYEDLRDVALVGFSYGGMVVTAVADRVPERIAQIIYLDAMVPEDGQSAADVMHVPVPSLEEVAQAAGDGWQVPHVPPQPRKTAQPIRTFIPACGAEEPRCGRVAALVRLVYPEFLPVRASVGGDCGQGRGARVALSGAGRRSHGTGDACPGAGGPIACA